MQFALCAFALVAAFATAALGQQQQQQQQPGQQQQQPEQQPGAVGMSFPGMSPTSMLPWTMSLAGANYHLDRLAAMFDMSHVSTMATDSPVMMAEVYDPATNKYTLLSHSVAQTDSGVYYIPVCSVDSFTSASSSDQAMAKPASDVCQYGIQLSQVPSNAAQAEMAVVSHAFDAIRSAAMPMFQAGGVSLPGMNLLQAQAPEGQMQMQPGQEQMQPGQEQVQPGQMQMQPGQGQMQMQPGQMQMQ